jgi:hypothetical protein
LFALVAVVAVARRGTDERRQNRDTLSRIALQIAN